MKIGSQIRSAANLSMRFDHRLLIAGPQRSIVGRERPMLFSIDSSVYGGRSRVPSRSMANKTLERRRSTAMRVRLWRGAFSD